MPFVAAIHKGAQKQTAHNTGTGGDTDRSGRTAYPQIRAEKRYLVDQKGDLACKGQQKSDYDRPEGDGADGPGSSPQPLKNNNINPPELWP